MFLFNRREVYVGNSVRESARIRDILDSHGIRYQYRVVSHLGQWSGQGTVRSFSGTSGVNLELDQQTYIFVKKADYDEAMYLIRSSGR